MTLTERIEKMEPRECASRPEVKALWDKGLLWSLAHRRSFKYPRGVEFPKDGFYEYKNVKEPVPLTEVELALLCWAGVGTNGLIRNDVSFFQYAVMHQSFEGRTTPVGDNLWFRYLIFSNDDGIFFYKPHVPTKVVEIETQEDMEIIFRAFKEGIIQLSDQPIRVNENSRAVMLPNSYFTFKPGTTAFFPIAETSIREINYILMAAHDDRREDRKILIDDQTGKPAGVQKWIDNGYLKGALPIPLSMFEAIVTGSAAASAAFSIQNIQLCAAAMGLGGYPYSGINMPILMGGTPVMRGLGFRFVSDSRGFPYSVGIDGVFGAHIPPYMSIDEAVDDLHNMKFGPNGRYAPEVKEGDRAMYPGFDPEPRAVHRPFKDPDKYTRVAQAYDYKPEAIALAKDACNYIYNTYRRLPTIIDPFYCPGVVQVHHIDPDLYDEYMPEGSIWQEQREHLKVWHGLSE